METVTSESTRQAEEEMRKLADQQRAQAQEMEALQRQQQESLRKQQQLIDEERRAREAAEQLRQLVSHAVINCYIIHFIIH